MHTFMRSGNVPQQEREKLIAVLQELHLIARFETRLRETDDGQFSAKKGGAQRASALEDTQGDAIARAREIDPKAPIHVERVRNTNVGSPDKWRRP